MNSRSAASTLDSNILGEPVLWKCLLLTAMIYLIWSEKLSIVLNFSPNASQYEDRASPGNRVKASMMPEIVPSPRNATLTSSKVQVLLPAGSTGNLTFSIDPGFADRNGINQSAVSEAAAKCMNYVDRFAPVAVAEMRKFGMPASVILAQGLLESNAGDSRLARNTNNHFGIKCFSNRCRAGHCINFTDDSHKDFFVKYSNVWSSFRAHSQFLKNSKRYAPLFELSSDDYRAWARGLQKAGYATDQKYAEKLIALIVNLHLDKFDAG